LRFDGLKLTVIRCLGAVLAVTAAVYISIWLEEVVDPPVVLLAAVATAAWFSGLWPAMLALALASTAFRYFFLPPFHSLAVDVAHLPRVVGFVLIGGLFIAVSARRREAEESLKRIRDDLDATVQQRTADLTRAHADAVAAQQRFVDLVNSLEGIVWEADLRSRAFSFVSQQAERMLGYPVEQWLRGPNFLKDHIHPEDRDWVVTRFHSATATMKDHDFEYRMVASNGQVIWVRNLVTVVVHNGEPTQLRGLMFDITARKQAEEALREQASLLNLTHDSIFVRDMNDVIRYWNRGAEELYDTTSAEALGRVSHELTRTIFPVPLADLKAQLLRSGRWEGQLRHQKRNGEEVIVASRWSLQTDADGKPLAILETNTDITDQTRAEAALRASEEQWKAVFENNPTMYFMVDPEGTVLSVNPFGADQLGYTVDALVGESVLKVFAKQDWDAVRATIGDCLRDLGQVKTWEIRKLRRDGDVIWVRETAKAMRRIQGGPVVLIACEDITTRKRTEQELEELAGRLINAQEQERSRIGRELHDHISQMLGVLTIRLDQLRAEETVPPSVADTLEALRHSTAEITTDIHNLSHRLHSSALDYLGLVAALQRLIKEFSSRHSIDIDFSHASLPEPLPSDVALALFRVTEESLTNIAKHSGSKFARIRLKGEADGIHLTIADTGVGFDMASFEGKGGLGFVSMRERLRALRGTVRVESAPSRGTTIHVHVPPKSLMRATAPV
jgi:PAS domain S-box-containing protein